MSEIPRIHAVDTTPHRARKRKRRSAPSPQHDPPIPLQSPIAYKRLIEDAARRWGDLLGHWRVCKHPASRQAQSCQGNVRVCFPANASKLPDGERVASLIVALAQQNQISDERSIKPLAPVAGRPSAVRRRHRPNERTERTREG